MTTSRKDFVAVAAIIKNSAPELGLPVVIQSDTRIARIANELADHFASSNPNFDRARFLEACGV